MPSAGHLLGAHLSIAGGYFKAPEAAAKLEMGTVQLFTKNNTQWKSKTITDEDVELFRGSLAAGGIDQPLSHSSYLLNVASPDPFLRERSRDALVVELQRAEQLGIRWVVLHPGAHIDQGEAAGLKVVVRTIREVLDLTGDLQAGVLFENTAGQGSTLGHRFDHLGELLSELDRHPRLGVCIDTCHAFAAGYPLAGADEYKETMAALAKIVGLENVHAFHLNDSKKDLGSRVDRHEHIGRGKVGLDAFRHLLNDRRFRSVPMYLETPKGTENGEELDAINLRTLRSLVT